MFKTPQKNRPRGNRSTPYSSSKKAPLRGLFQNNIWLCECDLRLPASHFQVKKEGPNKGRWFYTCQESKDNGCGFFLWDDDAAVREMGAVIGNTRSEPEPMKTLADPLSDKRTVEGHTAASNKFMADLARVEEDEFGGWSLSPEEERKLVQAVEKEDALSTEPLQKVVKTDQYATPSLKRKREDESLPTPISGNGVSAYKNGRRDDLINAASSSQANGGSGRFGLRSPSNTPTPSRFRECTYTSNTLSERSSLNYDIASEVMELLEGQKIEDEVIENLGKVLDKQALRVSGIIKGRDITRLALKNKNAKIAELRQRITALETERELDKTIIRHFQSDMAHSVEKRRENGRGKNLILELTGVKIFNQS